MILFAVTFSLGFLIGLGIIFGENHLDNKRARDPVNQLINPTDPR